MTGSIDWVTWILTVVRVAVIFALFVLFTKVLFRKDLRSNHIHLEEVMALLRTLLDPKR